MTPRRPLLALARFFSLYAAFYVVCTILAAVVGLGAYVVFALVKIDLGFFDESSVVSHVVATLLKPANARLTLLFFLSQLTGGVLLAAVWEQLAHVTRYIANGTFLSPTTRLVLKRLAILLVASFVFDVLGYLTFGPLNQAMAGAIENMRVLHPEQYGSFAAELLPDLFAGSAADLLLPELHGSIKLVLAVLAVFAHRFVLRAEVGGQELDRLRTEQSLVV